MSQDLTITTFQRSSAFNYTNTDMVRAECSMKGVTMEDMMYFHQKYDQYARQVERWFNIEKFDIHQRLESEQVDYVLYGMPSPYSNRDAVLSSKYYKNEESEIPCILKIRKSVGRADLPEKRGFERMAYYHGM